MITENLKSLFSPDQLHATYSYEAYMELMETVVREERTTGPNQSADYAHYTKLNLARMRRLNKTITLEKELADTAKAIQKPQQWFVLTEAWCGDAAQCVPVIARVAQQNPMISLTLLLRDENPEVMSQYLTNGGKSIPKLIAIDDLGNELFTWGPRPAGAEVVHAELKKTPDRPLSEMVEMFQRWYNNDKTLSLQEELLTEIEKTL